MRRMSALILVVAALLLAQRPPASTDADVPPPGESKVVESPGVIGKLYLHTIDSKHLGKARTIRVWMPANLDPDQKHPVIYMHDGQNLFDDTIATQGGWKMDDTVARLVGLKEMRPAVIVGIDNGGSDRIAELSYTPAPQLGGGDAEKYAAFVLEEVMPLVEAEYPVSTKPADRVLGGSSLGALVSLEMAYRHPDTFAGVLAMSPSIWWPTDPIAQRLARDPGGLAGTKVYLDMGTAEVGKADQAAALVQATRQFAALLEQRGATVNLFIATRGQHNEVNWARRLPSALKFLLPADESDAKNPSTLPAE